MPQFQSVSKQSEGTLFFLFSTAVSISQDSTVLRADLLILWRACFEQASLSGHDVYAAIAAQRLYFIEKNKNYLQWSVASQARLLQTSSVGKAVADFQRVLSLFDNDVVIKKSIGYALISLAQLSDSSFIWSEAKKLWGKIARETQQQVDITTRSFISHQLDSSAVMGRAAPDITLMALPGDSSPRAVTRQNNPYGFFGPSIRDKVKENGLWRNVSTQAQVNTESRSPLPW